MSIKPYLLSIMSVFILAGCTQADETTIDQKTQTVTITNYTNSTDATKWDKKEIDYTLNPTRVVANTRPAAELLLHLGLKENIVGVGADFGIYDESVKEDYLELNKLSKEYIGKEKTLSIDPNLIYGRGGLFANEDWGVGTTSDLNKMGIDTFILSSSLPDGTFNSVYDDIERTGQLFNKKQEATDFTKELKTRQDNLTNTVTKHTEPKTFAYIHSTDPKELMVYSAHDENFFNDVFTMVNLDNTFKDIKGDVSLETLIETDPDVLILPRWDSSDASSYEEQDQKLIDGILNNSKLKTMQAIKNKQVYVVDYNHMFGYGYQALDGMETLAREMYPELFVK